VGNGFIVKATVYKYLCKTCDVVFVLGAHYVLPVIYVHMCTHFCTQGRRP